MFIVKKADIFCRAIWFYFQVNLFTIYGKLTNATVFQVFDKTAGKRKYKPCFIFEDEVWTFDKV
jgi:hypothetical protein